MSRWSLVEHPSEIARYSFTSEHWTWLVCKSFPGVLNPSGRTNPKTNSTPPGQTLSKQQQTSLCVYCNKPLTFERTKPDTVSARLCQVNNKAMFGFIQHLRRNVGISWSTKETGTLRLAAHTRNSVDTKQSSSALQTPRLGNLLTKGNIIDGTNTRVQQREHTQVDSRLLNLTGIHLETRPHLAYYVDPFKGNSG